MRISGEAIRSGAFWFYHRLGFRPVEPRLAAQRDLTCSDESAAEPVAPVIRAPNCITGSRQRSEHVHKCARSLADVRGDFPILRKPYEIHQLSQAIAKLPR